MQVSWCYHSSTKALKSCFWVATFSSEIINKSDFSTQSNSMAEEVSPAVSVFLNSSVWPCFHHSEQLPVISNLHPFTVHPSFQDHLWPCWRHSSHYSTLWSPASASLLIASGSYSLSASWLLNNPCKHCMFSNYGPVYSKTLNNILQRFFGN